MYLEYNEDDGIFTSEELRHLSGAMGFPKELFEKNLPAEYTIGGKTEISVKNLLKCIEERCFHVDLHYTGNLKSGTYNTECLKKAVQFISKRYLSFKELLDVRLAFQAYEEYDQKGMKISEYTFLRTLKMCGRVISPKKLMHKVKHIRSSYMEQGRIQFYEFLDLLVLCELSENYDITYDLNSPVEKTWTKLYKIDNFKHFTIPKDKKLWKHLNKEYKEKELNYNRPELKSSQFVKNPLELEDFRTKVRLSNQQYETLHRSLRNSNKQVQLAKGGFTFARPQKHSKDSGSKRAMSASTGKTSWATTPQVSARPPTPVSGMTAFSPSPPVRSKRAQRPQSSPPVVSEKLMKDSRVKVETVQFDICTENQRWSEYYLSSIGLHLPNYPEVLRRLRKPPSAPRRKRFYRKERPSPVAIARLASHETKPPAQHVEKCDALLQGIGTDQHSLSLKRQAKKIRCKSAPAAPLRNKSALSAGSKGRSKYSSLLESLMQEYGYRSEDESSDDVDDEIKAHEEPKTSAEAEEVIPVADLTEAIPTIQETQEEEQVESDETEKISNTADVDSVKNHDSDAKQKIIEEYLKWRNGRRSRMEKLIHECGYYRPCIDPNEKFEKPPSLEKKTDRSSDHSSIINEEKLHKIPPIDEVSEFEKLLQNPDNLRIPHDVSLVPDYEDVYEKRKRLHALKRIASRYPAEERRWFMSLVRANKS